MKICFLELQPFPYNIGGGTTHVIDLSKYLIEQGHDVCIISSKPGNNQKALKTHPSLKIHSVGLPHKIFQKKNFISTLFNVAYRLLWEASWIIAARNKIREINPDICNPQSLISTSLPCSLSGTPFVATQHGPYLAGFRKLWSERRSKTVIFLSKIYELIEKYNARKAKIITCVGSDTYNYYKRFGKEKCIIITHGVDPDNFQNSNKRNKRDYLFVGRLTEQKGFSYLIEALSLLDSQGIKLTLNVAGDGDVKYVSPLKEKASKFKNIKVNFLGFKTGKDLYEVYASAGIFISASIFEPFGIVLTEAMASGCAIISADHEGARRLVKSNYGSIVDYASEKDRARNLAATIKKSLKWDIKKMGGLAKKESKKYSYRFLAKEYVKVFSKAIEKND